MTNEELAEAVANICRTHFPQGMNVSQTEYVQQVIRQLWEEREANRAVMEQAREALAEADSQLNPELPKQEGFFTRWFSNPVKSKTQQALAALDAALGNKGCK